MWLRWIAAASFGVMLVLNVMISLEFEKDKVLPSLTLVELGNMAYAQGEGGGSSCDVDPTTSCPGGSSSFTQYFGGTFQWCCTACCPVGKNPRCNTGGCECW